jgi:hypothetical protein
MSRARAQIVSSFLGLGIVSTWIVGGGVGCTAPGVASSNIASQPDAGAMSFGQVALGELPVFNNSIGPLQAAMDEVFEGDPAMPVLQVYLPGMTLGGDFDSCTDTLPEGPCLWVRRVGALLSWLPELVAGGIPQNAILARRRPSTSI